MSTTVTYKGETLTTVENQTRTLQTAGKYLEDDITLTDETGGGSGGGGQLYIFSDTTYLQEEAYLGNQAMSVRAAFTSPDLVAGVTVTFYTWGDYILDTIEGVTSGNTYPFTTVTRGTYTFTMPNESVDCLLQYDD